MLVRLWRRMLERWREDRRRYEELLDEIALDEYVREREEKSDRDEEDVLPWPAPKPRDR
jgi:hypothetical protein